MLRTVAIKNFLCFEDYQSLEFQDGASFIVGANATGKTAIFELTRRCLSKSVNTSHSCVTNTNDDAFVISKFRITKQLSDKLPEGCDLYSLYVNRHKNKGEIYKVVCITDKEKTHCYLDCYNRFKATSNRNEKDILKAMEGLITKGANTHYLKRTNDMVLMTRGKTEEALCDCEAVLQKLYDGDTKGALSDCKAVLQKLDDLDTDWVLPDCKAVLQKLDDLDTEGLLPDCKSVLEKLHVLDYKGTLSDCKAVLEKLRDRYPKEDLSGFKDIQQKLNDRDTEGNISDCKTVLEKLYDFDTEGTISDCKAVLKKLPDGDTEGVLSDCIAVLEKICDLDNEGALSDCKTVLEKLYDTEVTISDCKAVLKKLPDGDTERVLSDCIAVLEKICDLDTEEALSDCETVLEKLNDLVTEGTLSRCKDVLKKLPDGDTEGAFSGFKAELQKPGDLDTERVLSACKAVLKKLYHLYSKTTLSGCNAVRMKLRDGATEGVLSDCKAVLQKLRDGVTEEARSGCNDVLQKLGNGVTEGVIVDCKAVLQKLRDRVTKEALSDCETVLEKLGGGDTEEVIFDCKAVLKKLYDLDTKEALPDCETVLQTLNEAIAITFPIRSPGPIQWNHSENMGKRNEHYVTASNNAEILQRLIGSEDVDKKMAEKLFLTIINPLKYTFEKHQKGRNSIITVNDGQMRIPLLKVPEGIIEAQQFSLMFAHKEFQTLLLEEPDRAMHPQMVQKLRDILIRKCKDQTDQKTVILISHQQEMINRRVMSRLHACRRERFDNGNFKHFIYKLSEVVPNTYQHQDQLKQMLYSAAVLFVEGFLDKTVIGWVLDRVLDSEELNGFVDHELDKLKKIITETQLIAMDGEGGYQHMKQVAKGLEVPCLFLLDADVVIKYPKKVHDFTVSTRIKNVYDILSKDNKSTEDKQKMKSIIKSLGLPSTFKLKKNLSERFVLPENNDADFITNFRKINGNVFLLDSMNLEVMILKSVLETTDQKLIGILKKGKAALLKMNEETMGELVKCLLEGEEMKTFLIFLLESRD